MTIEETLNERNKTHGDYIEQAETAQYLKLIMRSSPNWYCMTSPMRESMELIATKISRILHGDPYHLDSWHDIAGYAELNTAHQRNETAVP
jgi:hypothetical protein